MAATLKISPKIISNKRNINDLEDITNYENINKKQNKNKKLKESNLKKDIKSVNFKKFTPTSTDEENENEFDNDDSNKNYNTRSNGSKAPTHSEIPLNIGSSPPKIIKRRSKSFGSLNSSNRSSHSTSSKSNSSSSQSQPQIPSNENDIEKNIDYLSLLSTLRLLNNQKQVISNQILTLSNYYNESQKDPVNFIKRLNTKEITLPKQNKILKSPIINFRNYNYDNAELLKLNFEKGLVKDKPIFKTLNLFSK